MVSQSLWTGQKPGEKDPSYKMCTMTNGWIEYIGSTSLSKTSRYGVRGGTGNEMKFDWFGGSTCNWIHHSWVFSSVYSGCWVSCGMQLVPIFYSSVFWFFLRVPGVMRSPFYTSMILAPLILLPQTRVNRVIRSLTELSLSKGLTFLDLLANVWLKTVWMKSDW